VKTTTCQHESSVLAATRHGAWNEAIRTHIAGCSYCRELVLAGRVMESLLLDSTLSSQTDATLSDPGLIWWKAQMAERQFAAVRARKRLDTIQAAILAFAAIGIAGAFALSWSRIQQQLIAGFWPNVWTAAWSAVGSVWSLSSAVTIPEMLAFCGLVSLIARRLVEE
jgi:late competence protein required for DNA uptake (superfamily II DNA/RNA helicase)